MLKIFNSLQITALFATFPFIVNWIFNSSFQAHNVLGWILSIIYVIFFVIMTSVVYEGIDGK